VVRIQVIRKLIIFDTKVYCCRAQFGSERLADEAMRTLAQLNQGGQGLTVRRWVERTGPDGHRDPDRRARSVGTDGRRREERRDSRPLVYVYDRFSAFHASVRAHKSAEANGPDPDWELAPPLGRSAMPVDKPG
jgi:hypothetical protein